MRARFVSFVLVVAVVMAMGVPAPAAEGFDTVVPLPDLESDPVLVMDASHLYLALDNQWAGVFTLDGAQVATLPFDSRVTSMSLSPDGSSIWLSSFTSRSIVAYDTATFVEVDRVTLPAGTCPVSSVQIGTQLLATNVCATGADEPRLVIVDLAGDRTPAYGDPDIPGASWLGVSPTVPNVVAGLDSYDPDNSFTIAVADRAAHLIAKGSATGQKPAFDPVADEIVIPTNFYDTSWFSVFTIPELTSAGRYDAPKVAGYVHEAAFSADGEWLAAVSSGEVGLAFSLFPRTVDEPSWQYALESEAYWGIALDADGSVLYAVTESDVGYQLHIIDIDLADPPPPLPLLPGSIEGRILDPYREHVDLGHADVYNADKDYLETVDAEWTGRYTIADLEPGDYYLVLWNGDEDTLWDFFPQWYGGAPLYRSDLARAVTVAEDETTSGVEVTLPWLYYDMFDNVFSDDIYWLGNAGITKGCNPPDNYLFCPDDYVTRGQMAAFINRAFDFGDPGEIDFVDDDSSIFESDIERLAGAGITKGCNPPVNDRFCPDALVTRGQMAAFMTRTFELVDRGATDFLDDDGSVFEADIERLAAAGITKGCNPPVNDRFCPDAYVTRGQMAAFFHRGFENVVFAAAGVESAAGAAQLPDRFFPGSH